MLAAIRRHLPGFEPVGASAGLHVVAWLPPGLEERPLVERAAARGVAVGGGSRYFNDEATARRGLLFGYGRVSESEIEEGIRIVAEGLRSVAA